MFGKQWRSTVDLSGRTSNGRYMTIRHASGPEELTGGCLNMLSPLAHRHRALPRFAPITSARRAVDVDDLRPGAAPRAT
jgi:hypothetical protein